MINHSFNNTIIKNSLNKSIKFRLKNEENCIWLIEHLSLYYIFDLWFFTQWDVFNLIFFYTLWGLVGWKLTKEETCLPYILKALTTDNVLFYRYACFFQEFTSKNVWNWFLIQVYLLQIKINWTYFLNKNKCFCYH